MMRIKDKKSICFIFIISALLSGMCFENVEMDSLFACRLLEETVSYIKSCDEAVQNREVCTTEMLGACNYLVVQQMTSGYVGQEGEIGEFHGPLCLDCIFLPKEKYLKAFVVIQCFYQNPEEIVTSYIHKSDGKKRIDYFTVTKKECRRKG